MREGDFSIVGGSGAAARWSLPRPCDCKVTSPQNCRIPAVAKGGAAIGTAMVVPGDEALVERASARRTDFGGEVGVSAWNGFAMARFCAQDAARLRTDMMTVLGRAIYSPLPRLWLN